MPVGFESSLPEPEPEKRSYRKAVAIALVMGVIAAVLFGISHHQSPKPHQPTFSETVPTVEHYPASGVILSNRWIDGDAKCSVKITNDSVETVSLSANVVFESADGKTQFDTYPAGSNGIKPGQSYTETPTGNVPSGAEFKCHVEDAFGYIPTD